MSDIDYYDELARGHISNANDKMHRAQEASADYATLLIAEAQVHATIAVALATLAVARP